MPLMTTIAILVLLIFWELIWKAIALWKAGRNNQLVWYIFIFILNTLGILPILYLLFFQKNREKYYITRSRPKRVMHHSKK